MGYSVQYYDLILVAIIASLGVGVAIGAWTAVAMPIAVVGLGAVSIGLVGHALFVNGPVDEFKDLTEEVELEEAPMVPDDVPLLE